MADTSEVVDENAQDLNQTDVSKGPTFEELQR